MPGTGGRGRIVGLSPETAAQRSALGALYCALMVDQSLDAVGSRGDIIIDGPFGQNALFAAALAALRAPQLLLRSDLRDGTAAGAALLARISGEADMPRLSIDLAPVAPLDEPGLLDYRRQWLAQAIS